MIPNCSFFVDIYIGLVAALLAAIILPQKIQELNLRKKILFIAYPIIIVVALTIFFFLIYPKYCTQIIATPSKPINPSKNGDNDEANHKTLINPSSLSKRKLTFSGTVSDFDSKKPILNAIVSLDSLSVLTDSLGKFEIVLNTNRKENDREELTVDKKNFKSYSTLLFLNSSHYNLKIYLNKL